MIGVSIYGDPAPGANPPNAGPQPGGGFGDFLLTCVDVIDPMCAHVIPLCDPGDPGFTPGDDDGGGDVGSGSNPCSGRGTLSPGRDVPEICTIISGWGDLPSECGGWCETCGGTYSDHAILPPGCVVAQPGPESDVCDPPSRGREAVLQAAMQLAAGWIPGQSSEVCEPTARSGAKLCTSCDANGNCAQRVNNPVVDPTVADGDCGANGCDEYGPRVNPDNWWKNQPDKTPPPQEPKDPEPAVPEPKPAKSGPAPPPPVNPDPAPTPPPTPPPRATPDPDPLARRPDNTRRSNLAG